MTISQAKLLKVGQRIRYNGAGPDLHDLGTIENAYTTGIEIKWDDGNEIGYSFQREYHFRNLEAV